MKPYMFPLAVAVYAALLALVGFGGGAFLVLVAISLLLVVTLGLGYVLGHKVGKTPAHDWYVQSTHTPSGLFGPAVAVTTVLYRCRTCPDVRTEVHDGVWTLADFTDGESTADQDQAIAIVHGGRP